MKVFSLSLALFVLIAMQCHVNELSPNERIVSCLAITIIVSFYIWCIFSWFWHSISYTINLYGEYPAAFHRPMMNIKCCSKRMGDTHKKSATSENMQSRYCYCYCSHLVTVICSFDPLSSLHSDICVTKTMRILHNVNCNQLQTVFC